MPSPCRFWLRLVVLAPLLVLPVGCRDADVARLEAASEAVAEAQQSVESARAELEARRSALESAREAVGAAEISLREAEQHLAEARAEVFEQATDTVLFRAVQKRLLDEDRLGKVAIAARVEQGTVVLSGAVPDDRLRQRAVEIARDTPGVLEVDDRIRVTARATP